MWLFSRLGENFKTKKGQAAVESDSTRGEEISMELRTLQSSVQGTLDVVLHKVDKIEESQSMILRKVEGLHTAIYDPDMGLFSRIKENATAAASRDVELDQKARMSASRLEELAKEAVVDTERHKAIDASITKINELARWQTSAVRVMKYVLLAVGTSVGGFLAKIVYDWITGHIRFI